MDGIRIGIRTTVNERQLKNIVLILPFTEPYLIDRMISLGNNTFIWSAIAGLFTLGRTLVVLYCATIVIANKIHYSAVMKCSLFYLLSILIATLLNGSFGIQIVLSVCNSAGVIFLCYIMNKKDQLMFYRALELLFGVYTVITIITTLIWPNGFNHALYKYDAIYFLGGKNAAFFYYILYLFASSLYGLGRGGRKVLKRNGWITIVMIITGLVFDSSGTIISLIPAAIFFFIAYYRIRLLKLIEYRKMIAIVAIIATIILSGFFLNNAFLRTNLEWLLNLFGRDLSFTGRTALWRQAIVNFKNHPMFGTGLNTTYILYTGAIQNQAHSLYLDMLSKYGLIVFACFCSIFLALSIKIKNIEKSLIQKLIVIIILCTLIHCITEDANQMLLFIIIMLCDLDPIKTSIKRVVF